LFLEDLVRTAVRDEILNLANLETIQELLLSTEEERQLEARQQAAGLRVRLGNVRRRISNITDNLAEEGRSRALLAKLAELEIEESEFLSDLARLDAQERAHYQPLTAERLQERADFLKDNLDRRILHGLVKRIVVERDDLVIRLHVEYYFPLPDDHPPNIMSIDVPSVGAPPYRHCYSLFLIVPFQRKTRVARKKSLPA
jgi:hypothetical protein